MHISTQGAATFCIWTAKPEICCVHDEDFSAAGGQWVACWTWIFFLTVILIDFSNQQGNVILFDIKCSCVYQKKGFFQRCKALQRLCEHCSGGQRGSCVFQRAMCCDCLSKWPIWAERRTVLTNGSYFELRMFWREGETVKDRIRSQLQDAKIFLLICLLLLQGRLSHLAILEGIIFFSVHIKPEYKRNLSHQKFHFLHFWEKEQLKGQTNFLSCVISTYWQEILNNQLKSVEVFLKCSSASHWSDWNAVQRKDCCDELDSGQEQQWDCWWLEG